MFRKMFGPKKFYGRQKRCVLNRTRNRAVENECGRGKMKYSEETQ
jgi:hypothetical protein